MKNFSCMSKAACAVLGMVVFSASSASAQTVYNANAQFDAATNPSTRGPWSYGSLDTLGTFSTLPVTATDLFGLQYWTSASANPLPQPNVAFSPNGFTLLNDNGRNGLAVDRVILLWAGSSPAALRFTAPASSVYTFDLSVLGVYSNGTTAGSTSVNFSVLANGNVTDTALVERQFTTTLTRSLFLPAGGTLDFVAASNLNPFLDRVQFSNLTVTQVPEPAALAFLAAPLALLARRRA